MKSKEIKDPEMDVNNKSDSPQKDDSNENTPAASTKLSTTDSNQSNEMVSKEIASTSKEEVIVKPEDSKVLTTDVLLTTDAKSEDCMVTSTSMSSSPESSVFQLPSEYLSILTSQLKDREAFIAEESKICMANGSCVNDLDNASASTGPLNCNESHLAKIPSEENLSAAQTPNIDDNKSHRENVHYLSESSDNETESSDSSDCDEFFENLHRSVVPAKLPALKTKGELQIQDLPPVEDLHITVDATELVEIGKVKHSYVDKEQNEFLVVVDAERNSDPLDEDSVLFLSSDNPLGKIHDVLGNVCKPSYTVRFNNEEDILNKSVTKGQTVYYSPENADLTRYVLVDVLKKQKGSDASWKDNNEPPDEEIDYSDDEQEKLAKQKRRAKNRRDQNQNAEEGDDDVIPIKMGRTYASYSRERAFLARPARNLQSHTSGPSRSSPRSYSPQSYSKTPSPSDHFDSSGLLRNVTSPQPFGLTSSNSFHFLQRSVQSPQPFGQLPHSNAPSPQSFGPLPHNNVPSPQPLGRFIPTNAPSLQTFGPPPHSNAPSPQSFGPLPHNNVPSTQPFGPLIPSNAQSLQTFGSLPHSNVPSSQPFGLLPHRNVPPPQQFRLLQHSNVPSPQPFIPLQRSDVLPPQRFGMLPHSNVPSTQSFGMLSYSNAPSPQSFGLPSYSNTPSPQTFGLLPHRNTPSPQNLGLFPRSNMHSPQPLGHSNMHSPQPLGHSNMHSPQPLGHSNMHSPQPLGHSNMHSPQSPGLLPHGNMHSPQPLGLLPHSNVPSPQPFVQPPHSNAPSSQLFGPFLQSSVSSYQPFTNPPTFVSASAHLASHAAGVHQLNPSSLMAAPQNNVPLQQQILLQGVREAMQYGNPWSTQRSSYQ